MQLMNYTNSTINTIGMKLTRDFGARMADAHRGRQRSPEDEQ